MAGKVTKRSKKLDVTGLIKQRRVVNKFKRKDQKKFDKLLNNAVVEDDAQENLPSLEEGGDNKKVKNTKIVDAEQDDDQDMDDMFNEDEQEVDDDDEEEDDEEDEDSEEEADEEEKEMMKKKDAKTKSKDSKPVTTLKEQVKQHKEDLAKLREKDPELFNFIGENEAQLLEFGNTNDDDEDDDVSSEEDDDEEDEQETPEEGISRAERGGVITNALIDHWVNQCEKEVTVKSIKKLLGAFKSAAHTGSGETDGDSMQKVKGQETLTARNVTFQITTAEVFNRVLILCLQNIPRYFDQFLEYNSNADESSKPKLPSTTPKWPQLEMLVKSYIRNLVHLTKQLSDPKMTLIAIKGLEKVICYLSCFEILPNNALNTLLEHWSCSNESVRVMSFLCIRKLAIITPYPFIDSCLKGVYLTYVKNSKFMTIESLPLVNFMVNCVVELFGLDFASSYRHAFIYIRQMAIHLRNTLNDPTHASTQNIYNWLYINGIRSWVELICSYPGQEELSSLIYPVTQLLLGVIGLSNNSQYYPLRLTCIRMLNKLSQTNKVFVNTLPFMFEMLSSNLLSTNGKTQAKRLATKNKYVNFMTSLSFQASMMQTNPLRDGLRAQILEVLTECLYVNSYHIGFPEFAVPAVTHVNRLVKSGTLKNPQFVKELSNITRVTKQVGDNIRVARDKVRFSPKDSKQVDQFAETMKSKAGAKGNALKNLLDQFEKKNQKEQELLIASKKVYNGEEEEEKKEKDQDDEDEDMGEEDGDDQDQDDDEEDQDDQDEEEQEDEEEVKRPKKKVSTAKPIPKESEDTVEDLNLSDDE